MPSETSSVPQTSSELHPATSRMVITTRCASGLSSSGVKVRPIRGSAFRVEKKPSVTYAALIRSGSPLPLISALVTFDLPVTLNAVGAIITPVVGTVDVNNVEVSDNPFGANEAAFAAEVAELFPLAAGALGALFGEIPLPTFQGLTVTGAGSGYNVSCTAIYLNLQ